MAWMCFKLGKLAKGKLQSEKEFHYSLYFNRFSDYSEMQYQITGDKINSTYFSALHFFFWNNPFRDWKDGKRKQKSYHRKERTYKIQKYVPCWQLAKSRCWKSKLLLTFPAMPRTGLVISSLNKNLVTILQRRNTVHFLLFYHCFSFKGNKNMVIKTRPSKWKQHVQFKEYQWLLKHNVFTVPWFVVQY